MRAKFLAGIVATTVLLSLAALAQSPAEEGVRAGAGVGGAAGAIVGGAVGAAVELPGDVVAFVTGHPRTYERVTEKIVVGRPLPGTVRIYTIPSHDQFAYAYVNDERVIVEPRTRRVIRIID